MRLLFALLCLGTLGFGGLLVAEARSLPPVPAVGAVEPDREPTDEVRYADRTALSRVSSTFGSLPTAPLAPPEPPHLSVDPGEVDVEPATDDVANIPQQIISDGPHAVTIDGRIMTLETEIIIY